VDADGTTLAIGRFPHAGKGLRTINEMAKVKAAGAGNLFALSGNAVLRMDAGREQDGSEHCKLRVAAACLLDAVARDKVPGVSPPIRQLLLEGNS
jgi:hypothetical protein